MNIINSLTGLFTQEHARRSRRRETQHDEMIKLLKEQLQILTDQKLLLEKIDMKMQQYANSTELKDIALHLETYNRQYQLAHLWSLA